MRISIVLTLSVVSLAYFSAYQSIFAQSATPSAKMEIGKVEIGQSVISPHTPLYALKTVKESFEMFLSQTSNVYQARQLEFSIRRLREINTLIAQKREDLTPNLIEHYLQQIQNYLHIEGDTLETRIKKSAETSRQMEVLYNLYNKSQNLDARRVIRWAIIRLEEENRLLIEEIKGSNLEVSDKLNLSQTLICEFLDKESKSQELNQSQQVITAEYVTNCFNTLSK